MSQSGHADAVWAVAFSPDGRSALSGSADGEAIVWETFALTDLESGAALPSPLARCPAAAISVDSAGQIAVADVRGRIHRIHASTPETPFARGRSRG